MEGVYLHRLLEDLAALHALGDSTEQAQKVRTLDEVFEAVAAAWAAIFKPGVLGREPYLGLVPLSAAP